MSALTPFVDVLLEPSSSDARLAEACVSVYEMFRGASPVTFAASESEGDHALAEGLAISPRLAAQCLLDARRTAAFLRGTRAAIESFARPIEVVYAGTGPFAPLALLLMDRLDPRQVRFTLIDVDRGATDSVRALLDHFRFSADVICADATAYHHPRAIDLVISETMRCALRREPFVAIARNLVPQLGDDGRIVPERVSVVLALVDQERNPVARLAALSLDTETIVDIAAAPDHWLALVTEILVFGDRGLSSTHSVGQRNRRAAPISECGGRAAALRSKAAAWPPHSETLRVGGASAYCLAAGDSGLTQPEILWPLSPVREDISLVFRYETGRDPGFRWAHTVDSPA